MKAKLTLAALLCLAALPALADRHHDPMPVDTPPVYKAECGSCHLAFPPGFLVADDWKRVMAKLDKHYGDNASLDEPLRRQIEDYLVNNAGSVRRLGDAPGDPPRFTDSRGFQRRHHEVPASLWQDKRVGSAANCGACHTRAEQGSFREREIRLPGGRRWED